MNVQSFSDESATKTANSDKLSNMPILPYAVAVEQFPSK